MSSDPSPQYVIAWLYIDGNIIHNGVDGCSYDRPMARLVKLDVTLKFKQLCDIIYAKLNIDTRSYGLKIRHRCFNPMTKLFDFAPVLDDDDVELMFELVNSLSVKNSVVELYLERVLLDGLVEKSVDVPVDVNCLSEQAGFLFDNDLEVGPDLGKCGANGEFCGDLGGGGVVVEGCGEVGKLGEDEDVRRGLGQIGENGDVGRDFEELGENMVNCDLGGGGVVVEGCREVGKRGEDGEDGRGSGKIGENGDVGRDFGELGENMEVSCDLDLGGGDVVRGHLNKKMIRVQHVNSRGRRRVLRGRKKGGESGSVYCSFDGSSMVGSLKAPVLTMSGDVLHVTDLKKGMMFVSREELADIVFQVHYSNQQEVKVTRADPLNYSVVCKQNATGCMWRLKARKRKQHGFFEIMTICGSHTCVSPSVAQSHANFIYSNVQEVPFAQVAGDGDPSYEEKVKKEMTEV